MSWHHGGMMPRQLTIEQDKIVLYLLNPSHPDGWSKAQFFLAHGFSVDEPEILAAAFFDHASHGWPGLVSHFQFGQKHTIVDIMPLPDGTSRKMKVIWQMEHGADVASLVTAYPQ